MDTATGVAPTAGIFISAPCGGKGLPLASVAVKAVCFWLLRADAVEEADDDEDVVETVEKTAVDDVGCCWLTLCLLVLLSRRPP